MKLHVRLRTVSIVSLSGVAIAVFATLRPAQSRMLHEMIVDGINQATSGISTERSPNPPREIIHATDTNPPAQSVAVPADCQPISQQPQPRYQSQPTQAQTRAATPRFRSPFEKASWQLERLRFPQSKDAILSRFDAPTDIHFGRSGTKNFWGGRDGYESTRYDLHYGDRTITFVLGEDEETVISYRIQ